MKTTQVIETSNVKMPMLQSATIKPLNNLIPIKDFKQFKDEIWVGEIVLPEHAEVYGKTIYFSREYNPANTVDQMIREYYIDDISVLGFPFLLIPKDKALFQFEPASTIIRPVGTFKKIKN